MDAPTRPYEVGGVSPAGPVRGHPGAEAGPGVAAVAEASPCAVRTTCQGDGGPPRLTRGGGRAVGGARGLAPVPRDGRGDGGRHPARRGVGVAVLFPSVLWGEGPALPPPGRPQRALGAKGVGYPGECCTSREHRDPRLGAAGLLCPDADVVVGDGGALRVPREDAPRRGLLWHGASSGGVHPGGGHPSDPVGASAVVPKVTLSFLMGDTMATQYNGASPESRAGRRNVSQTVAPREHFKSG